MSKGIDDQNYQDEDDDDQNENFGPLSMLVAQDLFGSSILPPSSRRRSMIDFRLTALDRNDVVWKKESEFLDIASYDEEDADRNKSSMMDSFAGTKLVTPSSRQQRRKSCPSLSFTWKEDEETATVRRGFGELDDVVVEASTSLIDCSNANTSSGEVDGNNNAAGNPVSVSHDKNFEA
eukprot:CAMPEP_0203713590 /NCGR_PEP_ID=MMETSP0091-20130426/70638_1 /ASSEMBLY_ACC=CAM_ASM_001089 /TAXON_ID=426623 /ORGANISM="Chaetoceros affinis, Strain CCMP159" /LENGTH=177 /DNA_ID=CAMNT_0050591623 /DNA_START=716 /DNA_END=1249 /DNA_ORIENTATION=+